MDWIVGLLLLIVGGVIGFFVARYLLAGEGADAAEKQSQQTLKEIMAQQAANHLAHSRNVVNTMQQQCDELRQQLDAYETLLAANSSNEQRQLDYFGGDAALFIRNQQSKQRRKSETADMQPRDFPDQRSGLFDGSKNQQVVDEKPQ